VASAGPQARQGNKSTERIDGIVAAIMAIGRAMVAQREPQPEYSMFFV
jgi:phage terminase large subunit-like protein